jgi:hypothetical protein
VGPLAVDSLDASIPLAAFTGPASVDTLTMAPAFTVAVALPALLVDPVTPFVAVMPGAEPPTDARYSSMRESVTEIDPMISGGA